MRIQSSRAGVSAIDTPIFRPIQESSRTGSILSTLRSVVPCVALWLILWASLNSPFSTFNLPSNLPTSFLGTIHFVRAFLPFIAAYVAIIIMLSRRSFPFWALRGPLGLIAFYCVVGGTSSAWLSSDPRLAMYWAGSYFSVLVVICLILASPSPLVELSRIISLNWIIVASLTGLFLVLGLVASGSSDLMANPHGALGGQQAMPGISFSSRFYGAIPSEVGMASIGPNGLGRLAALVAFMSFLLIVHKKRPWKFLGLVLLAVSLVVLLSTQSRTAILGLLVAGSVFFWLWRVPKLVVAIGAFLGLLLLWLVGFYQALWAYLSRGRSIEELLSLTGRVSTWEKGWQLFTDSPLLGFGYHADRIYLGEHMHNALLHAMVQSGLVGTIAFVSAFFVVWFLIWRCFRVSRSSGVPSIPVEIPALVAFFTFRATTESTLAFYGIDMLLLAPMFAYVHLVRREQILATGGDR